MIHYSVTINDTYMLDKYKMVLQDLHYAQPPEVVKRIYQIPGANEPVDMSEALTGYPLYENRTLTMTFGTGYPRALWPSIYSDIQNSFHNRRVKVIFDDDTRYYYAGRAKVESYERMRTYGTLTVTVDADPYKYEIASSMDDWLWDPFSFVDGIIRNYHDIVVNGTYSMRVVGSPMPVVPVLFVSAAMTVTVNGKEYQLKPGRNKLYGSVITSGEYDFIFTGNGTVSMEYRGGSL